VPIRAIVNQVFRSKTASTKVSKLPVVGKVKVCGRQCAGLAVFGRQASRQAGTAVVWQGEGEEEGRLGCVSRVGGEVREGGKCSRLGSGVGQAREKGKACGGG